MPIDLPLLYSGKVRDVYDAGEGRLLLVASDRISAFDVVMAEPIPNKGRVLTAMSAFWFERFDGRVQSHLISTDVDELGDVISGSDVDELRGRVMIAQRAQMLPIECIVRGYLAGSAWKEYRDQGTVHGEPMPPGLEESSPLPEPMFTPSTKAEEGHDQNISFEIAATLLGRSVAGLARSISLELYTAGAEAAAANGIIIADTKFELGFVDGELVVADEVMTPDSSRFWPADEWEVGTSPPSFDKQPVRDYLDGLDWDKQPPPPPLPPSTVLSTSNRYVEAYERITQRSFTEWPGVE
jgi:phosphoribosylaminoimidazole-succinocarboxamide synthase